MNLKLIKGNIPMLFFNWAFWIPVALFCTHLLLSIRCSAVFLESIRKPFIFVFIILLISFWFVRKITIHLDKQEPILKNYLKRLAKQALYGFLVPLSIMLILVTIYDSYIDDDAIQSSFLVKELCLVAFFLYIFNSVYITIALEKQVSITYSNQTKERFFDEKFLVYHRGYYVPINLIEIALIYQSGQLNWVVTFNDEKYILNLSLKEASDILNSKQFFKINRSQIVHKEVIQNLRSGSFGKIELTLKVQTFATTVSKGRAKDFRKWFNNKGDLLGTGISQ